MTARETPFSIVTATLGIGPDGTEDTYCVSDLQITYATEPLTFQCMATANPLTFKGLESWSGSGTLAYDINGMDQLWGYKGNLIFTVLKTGAARDITLEGGILITDVSSDFSNSELPQVSITFIGDGVITEIEAII